MILLHYENSMKTGSVFKSLSVINVLLRFWETMSFKTLRFYVLYLSFASDNDSFVGL